MGAKIKSTKWGMAQIIVDIGVGAGLVPALNQNNLNILGGQGRPPLQFKTICCNFLLYKKVVNTFTTLSNYILFPCDTRPHREHLLLFLLLKNIYYFIFQLLSPLGSSWISDFRETTGRTPLLPLFS